METNVQVLITSLHHGAVKHLIIHHDGDDADRARGERRDHGDLGPGRDGDGERDGGDEHGEAVADVYPKAPRRVLDVRRIETGVLREHDRPVLQRQRLRERNIFK